MSLYQKHRPSTLDEVKGNSEVISTLKGLFQNKETFPHAILFHGGTGLGKTTLARIVAKELGCHGQDLQEINWANFRGIDTVRDINEKCHFKPLEGDARIYVLDEVHKATSDAMNALLKLLEDPPEHVYFILCTTEPQKLLPTIRGRCSQFQVLPLADSQMFSLLRKIAREENQEVEREIYDQIIQDSLGHPRNAIQVLEQVLAVEPEKRSEVAKKVAEQQSQIIELCRALLSGDKWNKVKVIVEGLKGQEPEDIRRSVLGYMQAVLLKGENDRAAFIMEQFWQPTYDIGFPYVTYASYSVINT